MPLRKGELDVHVVLSFPFMTHIDLSCDCISCYSRNSEPPYPHTEIFKVSLENTTTNFPKKDPLSQEPCAVPRFVSNDLDPVLVASITRHNPGCSEPCLVSGIPQLVSHSQCAALNESTDSASLSADTFWLENPEAAP